MIKIKLFGKQHEFLNEEELRSFLKMHSLTLNADGKIVKRIGVGVIPEVLDIWFKQRVEYKNTMKKYVNEGNKELAEYYDRRQHIQKIFLNSLYGVLGLPVFRFYDVDNAAAVTLSGQDVIKNSARFVNNLYKSKNVVPKTKGWTDRYWNVLKKDAKTRKLPTPDYPDNSDHCVYIDTDSLYFSSNVFVEKFSSDEEKLQSTIKIARAVESTLNKFYDTLAQDFFFCKSHRFYIKGESIAKTGVWTGKKRYALSKIYDLETDKPVSKTVFKGLDVVRSSFPKAFKEFLSIILNDFLQKADKNTVDQRILTFKNSLVDLNYLDIARNTTANNVSQFSANTTTAVNSYNPSTPLHIKAAIAYNKMLRYYNIHDKYVPIRDGEKIKYVYLKNNPLFIEALAVKGYDDPQEIVQFIEQYIDHDTLFEAELKNKLQDLYEALNWGNLPTNINQNAMDFFQF